MYKDKVLTGIYREIQSKRDAGKYRAYFSFSGNPELADIVFAAMNEIKDMDLIYMTCNDNMTHFNLELDWEPKVGIFNRVVNFIKEKLWKS